MGVKASYGNIISIIKILNYVAQLYAAVLSYMVAIIVLKHRKMKINMKWVHSHETFWHDDDSALTIHAENSFVIVTKCLLRL